MIIKLLVLVLFQIGVVVYKIMGTVIIALAFVLPVSSDCDACATCQSLSNLSGTALQLQPVWTILFHSLHIPVPVVLGVWGLQRSNRIAPAAFILYSSALLARARSVIRRRIRRSRASGLLRILSRCFRYAKRGAVTTALNAGKQMKKNRVFPGASDGDTSIHISPSMKA
jgi:hypothetical protein